MDVLWQLQGEPTHATRERYRADRERLVRQPMIALLNEIADTDPRYEDFSVWHYRTDSWWWQHQGAVIRLGRKIEISLRFALDGLLIQGGAHLQRRPVVHRPIFVRHLGQGSPAAGRRRP